LCSIAEQVYFAALDRSWGANDDAGIVRLWTSDPVSSITSTLSAEEKTAKLKLVTDLLKGIHLVAAAEALSLAKHVNIPLAQIYELAKDAAGGSRQFEDVGKKMLPLLDGGADGDGKVLDEYVKGLQAALDEAQAIKCPSYLGNGALGLLLQTGKSRDLKSLLGFYSV
jgi:3-hydroxyisobutyrate dehydrogenase